MKIWYHNTLNGQRRMADVDARQFRIGRGKDNDIVLESPLIANEAALVQRTNSHWTVHALGNNGCKVAGKLLGKQDSVELEVLEHIELFPFAVYFEEDTIEKLTEEQQREELDRRNSEMIHDIHLQLLELRRVEPNDGQRRDSVEYLLELEHAIAEIAGMNGLGCPENSDLVKHIAGHCVRQLIIDELISRAGHPEDETESPREGWTRFVSSTPDREQTLESIVEHLEKVLHLNQSNDLSEQVDLLDREFWHAWVTVRDELLYDFLLYVADREIKKQIKDIVFGYGPLEDYLRLPIVSEIMVVDRNHIFVEKQGVIENSGRRFISDEVTLTIIDRIVSQVGRRIDKSQPLVDARLTDGSRVNAVIPPIAVSGPCITIRKFPHKRFRIEDLIRKGTLTETTAGFLRSAVAAKCNMLISGGTGTGKTTLLNCLADFIPNKERIVTIEDTAELQISKEHVVRMETKTANTEGTGEYTIHDLVKNALRMRPDRIIVGECRGGEALDMLQAMNTGHDGSLTTIHANNPTDAQLRLEVMVRTAADLPLDSIHRQIAAAVDVIIQLTRGRDGKRRITQITEVTGYDHLEGGIATKDLFHLEEVDGDQQLVPTGHIPTFIERLIDSGYDLDNFYL